MAAVVNNPFATPAATGDVLLVLTLMAFVAIVVVVNRAVPYVRRR